MKQETEIYNQYISTKLQEFMCQRDAEQQANRKEKDSFWATEAETPLFDLYHRWIGTPPTNPIDAEKLVMFSAGKLMEVALVEQLEKMGLVKEQHGNQMHFRIERQGVPISGYMDAIFTDGTPLEIKTFYGDYQAKELKAMKPKTSYLKQLAIYMDALDVDRGKLIYMNRGTGEMYEFTLLRDDMDFKCGLIEFNLIDVYDRWATLYNSHISVLRPPTPDKRYKYPLESIDWLKTPKSQIAKARTNKAVIGDWEVKYSPYKNLYIEYEKTIPGYTDEEIARIKEMTKGYSNNKS